MHLRGLFVILRGPEMAALDISPSIAVVRCGNADCRRNFRLTTLTEMEAGHRKRSAARRSAPGVQKLFEAISEPFKYPFSTQNLALLRRTTLLGGILRLGCSLFVRDSVRTGWSRLFL